MLNRLLDMLKARQDIDGWLISDITIESCELFFVGKALDMNRRKNVRHLTATVYRNFEEGNTAYTGSASMRLSPSMTDEELAQKISDAAQAASYVRNPAYALAAPTDEKLPALKNAFGAEDLFEYMPRLVDALYAEDRFAQGRINSSEFFLRRVNTHILNSRGVDERYTACKGEIELVVEWKADGEEVELFDTLHFSDFCPEKISAAAAKALERARLRASAVPLPAGLTVPVILRHENVGMLFDYYTAQSAASLVYQKYSAAKIGESIQGRDVQGDRISISLLPELENSPASRYIDEDGVKLHETQIVRDGTLLTYHGSNRYAQYLNFAPTGQIGNMRVEGGSRSLAELKQEPYLEVFYFSAFQMDEMTGDFGGEVRLGIYFDGEKEIPVSGGSVNGNIKDVQGSMQLSREMQTLNRFCGPQAVKLFGASISG